MNQLGTVANTISSHLNSILNVISNIKLQTKGINIIKKKLLPGHAFEIKLSSAKEFMMILDTNGFAKFAWFEENIKTEVTLVNSIYTVCVKNCPLSFVKLV